MTTNAAYPQATEDMGLREQVRHIVANLPRVEHQLRVNGEIDFYGASFCIARRLGLPKPLFGRATWVHDWTWYDVASPNVLVDGEHRDRNNLVCSKAHERLLREHGFKKAVAVGVPFLYADAPEAARIPDSILVFPFNATQRSKLAVHEEMHAYVEYAQGLRRRFSLAAACIGHEDVRCGNWIAAFEKAGIPWIAGAWTHDANALARLHALMRQFEYVTSNNPGSHFAYAAYCGCKASFHGPERPVSKKEQDAHPRCPRGKDTAESTKPRDNEGEFRAKYPFFFVEPREATVQADWAAEALGRDNRKKPEEIAELFEWKLRRLPSGRWASSNPLDALSNDELLAKAAAKSMVGRHEDAFKLANALKRRHARLRHVDAVRARYFLSVGDAHGAREALKEELRHFPDNAQAASLLQKIGGDVFKPHAAADEADKAFLDLFNAVGPFTGLNIQRTPSLHDLAMGVCREDVSGNSVECGVAAGALAAKDAGPVGAPDPAAGAPREQADASIRLSADGDADPRLAKVARHWASAQPNSGRTRWWLHPDVLRHVNACVCGSPVEGPWAGLERRMRELTAAGRFEKGVSVACGSAVKELHLLQEGLVGRFDLFEISRERVALGQASAAALGLSDRVRFHVRDAFAMELPGDYDLVYWNNALHHMFDVAKALQWSRERLQPGGWFVMDDFVGASRFQWPDVQLEIASRVRRVLPDRLLRDPGGTGGLLPRRLTRPSLQAMIERDPSEAADSDNILPAVKRLFPGASIVLTGGVVYNLALQDILANFEEDADGELLRSLLTLDADLAAKGLTHYACAFAPKQDG